MEKIPSRFFWDATPALHGSLRKYLARHFLKLASVWIHGRKTGELLREMVIRNIYIKMYRPVKL